MKRRVALVFITVLAIISFGGYASADFHQSGAVLPQGTVSLEECMAAATRTIHGTVDAVEFKSRKGTPIYEFEIKAKDGTMWAVDCDANTGHVREISKYVKPGDPAFKSQAKISQEEAAKLAVSVIPGSVDRPLCLIEEDGQALYEFDIHPEADAGFGAEFEVKIEAASGKIHAVQPVHWEIGHLD
ncbi:MAG: PepSY domain-containing protein [Deltaproteobacteria bacterium]|nr:PepSY domain-containing protein [Deltaproteobacteria bacterium]